MNLGKAKSMSVSLPEGLWELIDEAGGKGNRTAWISGAAEARLRESGLWPDEHGFDLRALIREAREKGVPVAEVLSREIAKINEGSAA